MKHCTQCGGEIGDEAKFCTWCGSAVAAAAAAPVAAAAAAVSAAPTPSPAPAPKPYESTVSTTGSYTQATYTQPTYPSAQTTYTQPTQQTYGQTQQTYYAQPTYAQQTAGQKKDGLGIAAVVFLGLSVLINLYNAIGYSTLISSDSSVIGLVVMYGIMVVLSIVLTVLTLKKVKSKEKISTGYKVIVLIFGSLISGILLFVRKEDQL